MFPEKFMWFNFEAEPKSSRYSYRSISITCIYKPSCEAWLWRPIETL